MAINPAAPRTTASTSFSAGTPQLKVGASGPAVVQLQRALAAAGFNPSGFDGNFGPKTLAAVQAFQKSVGLGGSGLVGANTWGALGKGNTAAPASTPAPAKTAAPPTIKQGNTGNHVRWMQALLQQRGFYSSAVDGKFGPNTHAAVSAFQKSVGLGGSGVVGPKTWAALAKPAAGGSAPSPSAPAKTAAPPTIKQGSTGDHVRWMQALLKQRGFYSSAVDGNFGPKTHASVAAFQRSVGLRGSGLVGPNTWAALAKPAAGGSAPAPSGPAAPVGGMEGPARAGIAGMLDWTRSMLGTKYAAVNPFRFGNVLWDGKPHKSVNGSGTIYNYPKGTRVFDCSGFVVAAFRKLGVDLAAKGLFSTYTFHADTKFLKPVDNNNLQPGDLVMYKPTKGIGHVVIYMGNGQVIESRGGKGVITSTLDWNRVKSIRRVPLPAA